MSVGSLHALKFPAPVCDECGIPMITVTTIFDPGTPQSAKIVSYKCQKCGCTLGEPRRGPASRAALRCRGETLHARWSAKRQYDCHGPWSPLACVSGSRWQCHYPKCRLSGGVEGVRRSSSLRAKTRLAGGGRQGFPNDAEPGRLESRERRISIRPGAWNR
jgi:hypothetical protein